MMIPSEIIRQLTQGHDSIARSIDRISQDIRSFKKTRPMLIEFDDVLAVCFGIEDEAFFDELLLFYAGDHESSKMLEFFICDLKELKIKYLVFFDKYIHDVSFSLESLERCFPKDFKSFSGDVLGRINIEAEYLIPLVKGIKQI